MTWLCLLLASLLADDISGGMNNGKGKGFPSTIEVPTRSDATWYGSPYEFMHLKKGKWYSTPDMKPPALSTWYGADRWSSSGKNRHSLPGRRPGDVLFLGSGEYEHFRVTRSFDLHLKAIKKNPTRWVTDDRTYTYLWEDKTLRLGLNNRDHAKGFWAEDGSHYWAWGHDKQTWMIGDVDSTGYPTTVVSGGRTYLEWAGAISFANIVFKGPTGSGGTEGILQTENPYVHDSKGNKRRQAYNWPEPGSVYGEWQGFRDLEFVNTYVDGEWDFINNRGQKSKWGCMTYRVGRSSRGSNIAGFRWHGGGISGIKGEHCFYFHNVHAMQPTHMAVHLKDLTLGPSERTAVQFVARESEGPNGSGRIILENITVRNVCLEQSGGGYAFTFAGNHNGRVVLRNIDCWLGDGTISTDNVTGGFVSHAGGGSGGRPTKAIVIEDSTFRVGPLTGRGSARRANLQVGDVKFFTLRNTTVIQADGAREAVSFDYGIKNATLGNNDVRGDVRLGPNQIWRDADSDGDGWDDGCAWKDFIKECKEDIDTNNDGVLAAHSGVIENIIIE